MSTNNPNKSMSDRLIMAVFRWNSRRWWCHVAWDRGEIEIPFTILVLLVCSPAILGALAIDAIRARRQ